MSPQWGCHNIADNKDRRWVRFLPMILLIKGKQRESKLKRAAVKTDSAFSRGGALASRSPLRLNPVTGVDMKRDEDERSHSADSRNWDKWQRPIKPGFSFFYSLAHRCQTLATFSGHQCAKFGPPCNYIWPSIQHRDR